MTQYSNDTIKPAPLWRRLLGALMSGPQWGRPQGQQDDDQQAGDEQPSDDNDNRPEGDRSNRPEQGRRPDADGPPDLDEIWQDLSGRLGGIFGGKGSNNSGGGGGGGGGKRPKRAGGGLPPISGKGMSKGVVIAAVVAVVAWAASGLFTVQEGERAVVLTFGKYSRLVGPGLSWRFPAPIETHETVATEQLRSVDIGDSGVNTITGLNNASMLTQDRNILDIRFRVQYKVKDLEAYLFNNIDAQGAVVFAAESAVREVLGRTPREVAITLGSCVDDAMLAGIKGVVNKDGKAETKPLDATPDAPAADAGAPVAAPDASAVATPVPTTTPTTPAPTVVATTKGDLGVEDAELKELVQSLEGAGETNHLNELASVIADENKAKSTPALLDLAEKTACPAGTTRQSLYIPIMITIQQQLDNLGLGVEIVAVNIAETGVDVPEKVKPAFDEARSATAEKESLINEGKVYANRHIASAAGVVARLEQDAEAYRLSAVAQAKGDTERFVQIYEQYRLAPKVTRNRMYLEAMQDIYSNVSKVMMESKNNSLLYVPLDKLLAEGRAENATSAPNATPASNAVPSANVTMNTPAEARPSAATTGTPQQQPSVRDRGTFGRGR